MATNTPGLGMLQAAMLPLPSGPMPAYHQLVQAMTAKYSPSAIQTAQWQQAQAHRNRSLRGRMYGDPVGEFMEEYVETFRQLILEDSEHPTVRIRHRWEVMSDCYKVSVRCSKCEKEWSGAMAAGQLHRDASTDQWEREFIRDVLAPITELACEATCFGVTEASMLAEWVTNRLAKAGEKGLPYIQVVHEAVEARLVKPRDVDTVMRTMKFVQEWVPLANSGLILPGGWDGEWTLPILHLPVGHPLRTW